ncbi:hypothetical protein JW698_02815 [Candidatus Wolfebacteria bacterium]|nr:hypothetical protein [Candidatus Wolfebacteria bacterium]
MKKVVKNKKTTKKPINEISLIERHFGVVLENMDSKLDLVVEGQQALDKKIDKNHQEFKEFRKETDYKFEVVFEKFDEVDKRFEQVDKRFDEVADELHIIRNELKEKVSRDEFLFLEKRVIALERARK